MLRSRVGGPGAGRDGFSASKPASSDRAVPDLPPKARFRRVFAHRGPPERFLDLRRPDTHPGVRFCAAWPSVHIIKHACKGSFSHTLRNRKKSVMSVPYPSPSRTQPRRLVGCARPPVQKEATMPQDIIAMREILDSGIRDCSDLLADCDARKSSGWMSAGISARTAVALSRSSTRTGPRQPHQAAWL